MTAQTLRHKLHSYIDKAEQKKLKVIYSIIENEMESTSILTAEQKSELDKRLEEYMLGKGKNYSWSSALKKIKSGSNGKS